MTQPITDEQLKEWRKLASGIVDGDWKTDTSEEWVNNGSIAVVAHREHSWHLVCEVPDHRKVSEKTAEFIASAPHIVNTLLDEIRRLRAELKDATTGWFTVTTIPADYKQCCPVCNKEINYDSFHHHDLQKQELHWECQHCKVKWISR
jgi:hypothetical protein